jgi:hypothetical protein
VDKEENLIFSEATVFPLMGGPIDYSVEETNYFLNEDERYYSQMAFKENLYREHFKGFNIWTTPSG